jgi:hypothetical protein
MASKEYLNAAFLSAEKDLEGLLHLLPDIPFVDEQLIARDKLASDKGRQALYRLVKNAIAAGEAADRKGK